MTLALAAINKGLGEVRQATLENRATIDYLLLLHHLGCQKFPGMCCFNITDNSKKVTNLISDIQEQLTHIHQYGGIFGYGTSWIAWLLPFITPILVLLCILLFGPCLLNCIVSFVSHRLDAIKLQMVLQTEPNMNIYRSPLDGRGDPGHLPI